MLLFPSPSALHTSAATNHGSPSSVFDRLPHAKIKNRNRLFLSETVSGTGWGDGDFRLMRHTLSGLKPARRWSIRGWGWPVWKSGFKIVLLPLSAVPCRIGRAARGEDDHSYHPQRKALTGQNKIKGRCAAPAVSGSQRPIHPALIVTPGNRNSDRLFP